MVCGFGGRDHSGAVDREHQIQGVRPGWAQNCPQSVEGILCKGVDAIVFLVDAFDKERFSESKKELDGLLSDDSLGNVPFLVLGNKIDYPAAASE
eukprot:3889010-Pyramimonas_sp.AAC.1